jgi:hypothetical protein
VGFAAYQALFKRGTPELTLAELGCILLGASAVGGGIWLRVNRRWLAYRSLAERFRSALYLASAGLGDAPEVAVEGSDVGDRSEAWIVAAARDVWKQRPPPPANDGDRVSKHLAAPFDIKQLKSFLAECWIERQIEYHETARRRNDRLEHRSRYAVITILVIVIIVILLHVGEVLDRDVLAFFAITLPVVAAAMSGVAEQREFRRHAKRYEHMVGNLQEMKNHMDQAKTIEAIQQLALDADAAIREERRNWFGTMILKNLHVQP